jgi:hypothetical protein
VPVLESLFLAEARLLDGAAAELVRAAAGSRLCRLHLQRNKCSQLVRGFEPHSYMDGATRGGSAGAGGAGGGGGDVCMRTRAWSPLPPPLLSLSWLPVYWLQDGCFN